MARERERAALAVLPGLLAECSALATSNASLVRNNPFPPRALVVLRGLRR